jgi:hypothetical protein
MAVMAMVMMMVMVVMMVMVLPFCVVPQAISLGPIEKCTYDHTNDDENND